MTLDEAIAEMREKQDAFDDYNYATTAHLDDLRRWEQALLRAADVAAELREWAHAARADHGISSSRAAEYEELAKRLEGAP